MAEDRKIHPQAGLDAKVSALSDLEYRVWSQYIVSANDLGVMPWTAGVLQGANAALDKRPRKLIEAAMAVIVGVQLLNTFVTDGTTYVWSRKWQDWQGIRYPRKSPYPFPSDLSAASERTRELFGAYAEKHGNISEIFPQESGKVSASRAYPRSGQARNPHSNPSPDSSSSPEESARETTPRVTVEPAWRPATPRDASLMAGESYHRRNCPAWAYAACQAGLCVPKFLWPQWEQRHDRDTAKLQAFVDGVIAATPPGSGDRPEVFWPAHFERAFGSTVTSAVTPSGRQTAAQRTIATMRQGLPS